MSALSKWTLVLLALLMLGACKQGAQVDIEEEVEKMVDSMLEQDFSHIHSNFFGEIAQGEYSIADLEELWETYIADAGAHVDTKVEVEEQEESIVVHVVLTFENVVVKFELTFSNQGKLRDIQVTEMSLALPSHAVEEDITIGEGTNYPLSGKLTIPGNVEGPVPAVVIVHGSGGNDMDGVPMFPSQTYRDIAYGLAEQGIASIRYDKRTFVHLPELVAEFGARFTVWEETIEDALFATALLKEDARIDADAVYLVGHSLGGMLAPRMDVEGGDFAGLVSLGGSPRTFWEIYYDQLLEFGAEKDEEERVEWEAWLMSEREKAEKLLDWTEEEAEAETVFEMPAFYLRDMLTFDMEEYMHTLSKPLLVLHGDKDAQVRTETDFVVWQQLLAGQEKATLKNYPQLNHLFVREAPNKEKFAGYQVPAYVAEEVIVDMAEWMKH
ncbi:alpha/beta fold hydrolase [Bacillus sp. FSL W7-1360]